MAQHAKSVVLALHYQNEVLHPNGKIRVGVAEESSGREAIVRAAKTLLDGARAHQVPVISVRIAFRPDFRDLQVNGPIWENIMKLRACEDGTWGAQFFDELAPAPGEFTVNHTRINAFYGSQLQEIVDLFNPDRLIVAGIATNYVVQHTVTYASDAGYRITVVGDACSSGVPELHEGALRTMSLLGSIETADQVVAGFRNRSTAA
ncbi:MAG: cysteine hydrolase [Candidatus Binataceae bacterium]|nr:cysteine hydrolase [Candidatus Binataceae bacterium]